MYWNKFSFMLMNFAPVINRNMRCIEICQFVVKLYRVFGLIETWDVLKYVFAILCQLYPVWLIETWDVLKCASERFSRRGPHRLIETWDVLKCYRMWPIPEKERGLIETWDVLKYRGQRRFYVGLPINRNMRCIEITYGLTTVLSYP